MRSRFALIAAFATTIGVSAAAGFALADVRVGITYDRGRAHYDRYTDSHWANEFHGQWKTIAEGSGAEGRREFMLGNDNVYSKLRIEATRGAPAIEKLAVNFGDGSTQVIPINSRLSSGGGEILDLNGSERKVIRVIVYPMANSHGAYSVFGG
jgi:hypothetical protein